MINIRQSVFETNSSSIHTLCIAKKNNNITPEKELTFGFGEFGWDTEMLCTPERKADYLWTAVNEYYQEEKLRSDFENYIYDTLGKHNCEAIFEEPHRTKYGYLQDGYIDHSEGLDEFLEYIKRSEKALMRFLFSPDSFVITGNDNDMRYVDMQEDVDREKCETIIKGC